MITRNCDGPSSLTRLGTVLCLLWWACILGGCSPTIDDAASVLNRVTGQPIRPFSSCDNGRSQNPEARSVLIDAEDNEISRMVYEVRAQLPTGFVAFHGTYRWDIDPRPEGVELVVARGNSQFDILRAARTSAPNFGMDTEALIRKFQALDELVGIDIYWADADSVFVDFDRAPEDKLAFARLVCELSPLVAGEAENNPDFFEEDIRNRCLFFWWD